MNLKLKHEDLVPNYNAIITLIFIFYYRLHCFSVPTAPEQRKTTSSSLAGERGGGGEEGRGVVFFTVSVIIIIIIIIIINLFYC